MSLRILSSWRWSFVCDVVLLWVLSSCAFVQADVVEEEDVVQMLPNNNFGFTEETFEQWVFQNHGNSKTCQARFETQLKLRIEDIDRVCKLTEAQRMKLRVAGRIDVVRFMERVEVSRKKFNLIRNDQNKVNEIWQDIQPLQTVINTGLFGQDSFFQKAARKGLDAEQVVHFDQKEQERRNFRYQATVQLVVTQIENGMPMLDEQRQKFTQLILEETKPPARYGQYDFYIVLHQMAKIPEAKLRPLFDKEQWKVMQQQLNQGRGMEQWLKQMGFLDSE